MAMKKYAKYTKKLRALECEAVRIQKEADKVYARGCTEVIAEIKARMEGKWVCLRKPDTSDSGMTVLSLYHVSGVEIFGTYYNDCTLVHINIDDSRMFKYYSSKVIKPETKIFLVEGSYLSLYIEKDFSLWYCYDDIPFEELSCDKYVKKALKYMEDNKL